MSGIHARSSVMKSNLCILAIICSATITAGDEPDKAIQEEWKRLEGEWRVVSVELDGKVTKPETIVKFADGKVTISEPGRGIPDIEITVTLDPTKKPKWMDTTNARMRTDKGIYKLKGDSLKAVFGANRPAGFQPKNKELMYTYERVNKK
jgi:uncharacterized protein (TIGR03067 family)